MNVKELTEFLSTLDPETEVWASIGGLSKYNHRIELPIMYAFCMKDDIVLWGDYDDTGDIQDETD